MDRRTTSTSYCAKTSNLKLPKKGNQAKSLGGIFREAIEPRITEHQFSNEWLYSSTKRKSQSSGSSSSDDRHMAPSSPAPEQCACNASCGIASKGHNITNSSQDRDSCETIKPAIAENETDAEEKETSALDTCISSESGSLDGSLPKRKRAEDYTAPLASEKFLCGQYHDEAQDEPNLTKALRKAQKADIELYTPMAAKRMLLQKDDQRILREMADEEEKPTMVFGWYL